MAKRLLFVDDEEALRTVVQEQLAMEGFDVATAEDGDVAIEMLEKDSYDLVLLDIRMPRMDGLTVLKEMRSRKLRPRVIMLTGADDLSVAIQSVKLGANDYVTKPYEIRNLLACINRVLAR
jgi:DNA-binding response OmpR family regulator